MGPKFSAFMLGVLGFALAAAITLMMLAFRNGGVDDGFQCGRYFINCPEQYRYLGVTPPAVVTPTPARKP